MCKKNDPERIRIKGTNIWIDWKPNYYCTITRAKRMAIDVEGGRLFVFKETGGMFSYDEKNKSVFYEGYKPLSSGKSINEIIDLIIKNHTGRELSDQCDSLQSDIRWLKESINSEINRKYRK